VNNAEPLRGIETLTQAKDTQGLAAAVKSPLLYLWDRVRELRQLVKTPESGTLNPDQKPKGLQAKDTGRTFFSIDFNREYTWNGLVWTDSPTAPARFQRVFFASTPEPSTGWAPCNGAMVTRSTSAGNTVQFNTPTIPADNGQQAWIRL